MWKNLKIIQIFKSTVPSKKQPQPHNEWVYRRQEQECLSYHRNNTVQRAQTIYKDVKRSTNISWSEPRILWPQAVKWSIHSKPHTITFTLLEKRNILCLSFPLSCYVILHSVQTSFNKHICQVQCTNTQTSRQNARLLQTLITSFQLSICHEFSKLINNGLTM